MVTTACDVMQQFLSISAVDNLVASGYTYDLLLYMHTLMVINELKVTNSTQYCSKTTVGKSIHPAYLCSLNRHFILGNILKKYYNCNAIIKYFKYHTLDTYPI